MSKFSDFIKDFNYNWNNLKNTVEAHTGIITGIGIGFTVVGTVLACRATLKVNEKAEEHIKLLADTKANCIEAGMDEKATRKEVIRAYRHIGVDYVRKFWPSVAVSALGYVLIIKSHGILSNKYNELMASHIALEALFNKYRESVAERYGENVEKDIMKEAQMKFADEHVIDDDPNQPFVNGSYLLFNENCRDYQKGCPQANWHTIDTGYRELQFRFDQGRPVYIQEVMRCFGHPEVKNGWKWVKKKGITPGFLEDFGVNDKELNPEFTRGVCFDGKTEPIAKLFLNDFVYVDRLFDADVRESNLADGGVMGGKLGKDPVIIG